MYMSTSRFVSTDEFDVEVGEEDGEINVHFEGLYLAFPQTQWDALVRAVAEARGLPPFEQPFSGVTLVPVPPHEEST